MSVNHSQERQRFAPLGLVIDVVGLVLLISCIHLVLRVAGGSGLQVLAVYPGEWWRVWSAFTAPLIHANVAHLVGNIVYLIPLLFIVAWRARARIFLILLYSAGGAWVLTNVFGHSQTAHLGASGLVFGLAGYVMADGVRSRRFAAMLMALLVLLVMGGTLVSGLFPEATGISWEGHLGGLCGGVLAAFIAGSRPHPRTDS